MRKSVYLLLIAILASCTTSSILPEDQNAYLKDKNLFLVSKVIEKAIGEGLTFNQLKNSGLTYKITTLDAIVDEDNKYITYEVNLIFPFYYLSYKVKVVETYDNGKWILKSYTLLPNSYKLEGMIASLPLSLEKLLKRVLVKSLAADANIKVKSIDQIKIVSFKDVKLNRINDDLLPGVSFKMLFLVKTQSGISRIGTTSLLLRYSIPEARYQVIEKSFIKLLDLTALSDKELLKVIDCKSFASYYKLLEIATKSTKRFLPSSAKLIINYPSSPRIVKNKDTRKLVCNYLIDVKLDNTILSNIISAKGGLSISKDVFTPFLKIVHKLAEVNPSKLYGLAKQDILFKTGCKNCKVRFSHSSNVIKALVTYPALKNGLVVEKSFYYLAYKDLKGKEGVTLFKTITEVKPIKISLVLNTNEVIYDHDATFLNPDDKCVVADKISVELSTQRPYVKATKSQNCDGEVFRTLKVNAKVDGANIIIDLNLIAREREHFAKAAKRIVIPYITVHDKGQFKTTFNLKVSLATKSYVKINPATLIIYKKS